MKTIYLAVAPYDWDVHSLLVSKEEAAAYHMDNWTIMEFHIYGDEDFQMSLNNLANLCNCMLETNCQNSWDEVILELMED